MNKYKIIHLAHDEKFIKYAYKQFKELEIFNNDFRILSHRIPKTDFKHIDFDHNRIEIENLTSPSFISVLNQYDLVVIHFLNEKYFSFIKNKNMTSPILWLGWGGDYYHLIDTTYRSKLYKTLTNNLINESKFFLTNFLKSIFKKMKRRSAIRVMNRIDYFAPVLYEDYQLIKNQHVNFLPKYIDWNYGTLEHFIKGVEDHKVCYNNILIGNSSTPSNNHLDLFNILKKRSLCQNVIVPLNYGDIKYGDKIENEALKTFGSQVVVLREFLDYKDYLKLISSCGLVFMGHIRQQALGNILVLLYIGSKIFFYKDSVTYQYLKRNGLIVYELESFHEKKENINSFLTKDELERQRKILFNIWGATKNHEKTKNVLRLLEY